MILFTLVTFWQVQYCQFINDYDDHYYITGNSYVQNGLSWKGIAWAFTTFYASNWHPLTWLSLMFDYELFRLNPAGYHWTNVFFHIASTLLLFLVLNRMTGALWRSGFVAALFAVHPLHVESVVWVAERKDVLCTFFWMLTMYTYVLYVERPCWKRYMIVFVSFSFGLMAKPMLVTLPFVFLLLDYWPLQRFPFKSAADDRHFQQGYMANTQIIPQDVSISRLVLEKIPFIVLSICSSILTVFAQNSYQAIISLDTIGLHYRVANAFISVAKYIEMMFWPKDLAIFYPFIINMLFSWRIIWSVLLFVTITIFAVRWIRRYPYLFVGWFWYLGTLVPVIGLVQVGSQAIADRYTYVPLIGIFITTTWGFTDLLKRWNYRKAFFSLTSGIILSALMVFSWFQVQHWKNSITVFERAVSVTEKNVFAHNNLGVALYKEGKYDEAFNQFMKTAQIKPDYYGAYNSMGLALAAQGKWDEAIRQYLIALKIKPDHPEVHNNLGIAYASQGKVSEAVTHYSQALMIKPDYFEARNNLGLDLVLLGRYNDAVIQYTESLRLNPASAMTHNNIGVALANLGKFQEAMLHFQEALRINPDYVEAYKNLQYIQQQQKKQ
ncbi:MAG: tetratricopeptide repeat protein [Syntrophaceae bacterium]